ncbi:MAG: NAD(P)(+) transhydrogenase (Re/Si-specific) subunit alpha, partial [Myxococcota bacterium]
MIVGVPKETTPGERRVGLVPDALKVLSELGIELVVQTGAGLESGFDDAAYQAAGAKLETDAKALLGRADLVVKVQPPGVVADGS